MSKALPAAVVDPLQALDAWEAMARRLASYGVSIAYRGLPTEQLSDWDSVTNMLVIRADAGLDDQVWVLQQMWNYLAIGPHAAPAARRAPILTLVPAQRVALDFETT